MNNTPQVFKIGICKTNNQKINEINEIEVLSSKGILGDRHFNEHKDY